MDCIICPINMLSLQQTIFCPDGTSAIVPTDALVPSLVSLAKEFENYSLKFTGNREYVMKLIERIKICENQTFGMNNISCEFIGGTEL